MQAVGRLIINDLIDFVGVAFGRLKELIKIVLIALAYLNFCGLGVLQAILAFHHGSLPFEQIIVISILSKIFA
jgi:hypothetical protein